jgi:ATP-binding cassette subfamily F protein 3
MIVLQAQEISKAYGGEVILEQVSFALEAREKVGLIGVNGSGKSTLLGCVTGTVAPDSGGVTVAKELRLGYLQQMSGGRGDTLWEAAMLGFTHLTAWREEIGALRLEMSACTGEVPENLSRRYDAALSRYEHAGGYAAESMAKGILAGLGFAEREFTTPVEQLSGGQKTRLYLTALLISQPDILLLDEPTNHLDIAAVEWLEHYLREYKGAVLLVSHDRRFLNRTVTRILELTQHQCRSYAGNYDQFLVLKEQELLARSRAVRKQEAYIAKTEAYITRYRAGIKSKQAAGREKQLQRLPRLSRPEAQRIMHPPRLQMESSGGKQVVRVTVGSCGYGAEVLLTDTELVLRQGERVGLIGANGSGKTTLLKLLTGPAGEVDFTGEIIWGSRIVTGYFAQGLEQLDPEASLLEEILRDHDLTREEARGLLGSILFSGDAVEKKVAVLSGGEKARLTLLKMILSGANFLLLDEPTNHLDIASRQVIEALLSDYSGTLLVVSHDRYFLEQVVERIVAVEDKKLEPYPGGYEDYLLARSRRETSALSGPVAPRPAVTDANELRRRNKERERELRRLDKQIVRAEADLQNLNAEKCQLEQQLGAESTYQDFGATATQLSADYDAVQLALEAAETTWLLLQAEREGFDRPAPGFPEKS